MRAGVYLRQSKDALGTGLAIARQAEDCLRLCKERGWEPVQYVDNDRSAYSGKNRPAYRQMLADIEAGSIHAVVTWDLDRLHRRPVELESFIELADRMGLALATVSGDTDLGTDSGRLFARVKGAVARSEGERKSARQQRAALQAAEAGKSRGGPRAFGYCGHPAGGTRTCGDPSCPSPGMTVMEREADALRRAYGDVIGGRTLAAIARDLTSAGFTTPRGSEWRHNAVRVVLGNPRNAGLRAYRGEVVADAQWPAIVDRDTWRAVRDILDRPERRKQRGTARRWLLSGLARCGVCDDGTTVCVSYRERGADGKPVRIYRCRDHAHLGRDAEFVERVVEGVVIAVLSRPDARDRLLAIREGDGARLDQRRAEADILRQRLELIAQDYADGLVSRAQLRAATERLNERLSVVENALSDAARRTTVGPLLTAGDVTTAWAALPLDRRRSIIDLLTVVTIRSGRPGRGRPDPATVEVRPRDLD